MADQDAARPFESILRNFEYSVEGYRLFLDQLHEPLRDSHEETESRTKRIVDSLRDSERSDLVEALRVVAEGLRSLIAGESTAHDEANGSAKPEDAATLELSGDSAKAFIEITQIIQRSLWTGPAAQRERLYRSVIIGLVGQFEVLISDVAHQYFRQAPGALNADEKVLSLSDLQRFGSVDGALDYLVDRQVDKLLAQTAEDWAKFFDKRMKIQLRPMAWDWEVFKEVIQRRHIIVHADGRVSHRYLENVSSELVESYFGEGKIGQATRLDRDYVERALDHFEIFGTLLCCTAWLKLDKRSQSDFEQKLVEWVYDRLLKGRWEMALTMARAGETNKTLSHSTRLTCRLNAWLCLNRLGRFDDVKDDVESFDDSALENRFRLARLAILDRKEEFFRLLETSEGVGLDREAWTEWPVFAEMRQHTQFSELRARFAPGTTADTGRDAIGSAPPEGRVDV